MISANTGYGRKCDLGHEPQYVACTCLEAAIICFSLLSIKGPKFSDYENIDNAST